jgi:hypothetical protein
MVNTCGHPFVRRSVSVLDQFRTAEEQVAKRLRELKPLVAEYHELEQVAQRLGLSVSNDAPAPDTRPPTSTKPARRRRRAAKAAARSAASKRDGSADTGTAKASVAATQARGGRSPQSSAGNGRAGASRTSRRQQDVLRLVKQRPGITVSEIAKELGVGRHWPVPARAQARAGRRDHQARRDASAHQRLSLRAPHACRETAGGPPSNRHVASRTPSATCPRARTARTDRHWASSCALLERNRLALVVLHRTTCQEACPRPPTSSHTAGTGSGSSDEQADVVVVAWPNRV